MIGIIGAMGIEVRALAEKMEDKKVTTISGIEFCQGRIHGKEVVLAVCGIGKVFAAICTQTMILTFHPDVIINTGVAGTLSPDLAIGDIAVSTHVVQHDMDTTALGDPPGLISGLDIVKIPADEKTCAALSSIMEEQKIYHQKGVIATGDSFLASNDVKRRITETFGAIAGEMEGGAVGHVCFVNRVPFCILRAISDCADGSGADNYMEFLETSAAVAVSVMDGYLKSYGE